MATSITFTPTDIWTVITTAGSLTKIEAVSRGTSGRFVLTDPALNDARGFWQPLIAIELDYPAPVIIGNNNSVKHSSDTAMQFAWRSGAFYYHSDYEYSNKWAMDFEFCVRRRAWSGRPSPHGSSS
jgi:hypothetical protein